MLDFPNTPTVGQQYTLGDKTWQWSGVAWDAINPYATKADLAAGTGASLVTFTQAGTGAVVQTVQDFARERVSVTQYMTDAQRMDAFLRTALLDCGPAITAANTYAKSVGATLKFPAGLYGVGAGSSFTLDPMKACWHAEGLAQLQWLASPTAGYGVKVVSSTAAPYATARDMARTAIGGVSLLGGASSGTKYAATALQIGDGTNQTFGLSFNDMTIQGWDTLISFQNNAWWITFNNMRALWGAITTPATFGNWGESNGFNHCKFLDGVTFTANYGDWTLVGGSLDNSKLVANNNVHVKWFGAHIENPGTTTLIQPFVDIQGSEATVHLCGGTLVIGNNGSPITQAPFNVVSTNTQNGLILDDMQYTQGAFAGWYSMVDGGGRVRVRNMQPLAFSNANYQVFAENTVGQLRNYNFETGDLSGWTTSITGTGTVAVSTARKRRGTYSALLTATNSTAGYADATLKQKLAIRAGERLALKLAFNRNYASADGVLTGQIVWLDAAGAQIIASSLGYYSAASGTDDGGTFYPLAFNGNAPGGTAQAEVQIQVQRPSGSGSVALSVDDIFVNVV